MVVRIQIRRDIKSKWEEVNPILASGELGLEIDTKKIKIGDGENHWNTLEYSDSQYLHLIGDETISGKKTFTDELITRELILTDINGVKISNSEATFLKASANGTVFICGYGDEKKVVIRPNGELDSNNAVTIDNEGIKGNLIGNVTGTAEKASKDILEREITETYALKTDIPTKVSDLENDKDYKIAATTLAGYGITDAKIVNNTITLGEESITIAGQEEISDKAGKSYVDTELDKKQDIINDLATIRSGATLGATALQSVPSIYALKTDIPTNISSLNNDVGYVTSSQDISGKADKSYVDTELGKKQDTISDLTTIRSGAELGATALQSVPSIYALKTDIPTKVSAFTNDSNFVNNTQLNNQLNTKISKNGSLNAFVISAGNTDTGWYRLWSDGFKEQGGNTLESTLDEITFENPFSDENYTIIVTPYANTNFTVTKISEEIFSIESTSECIKSWEAKGY